MNSMDYDNPHQAAQDLVDSIFKIINPIIETGIAKVNEHDFQGGLDEFDNAILLIPDSIFQQLGNKQLNEQIKQLFEGFASIFYGRAAIKIKMQDYRGAIDDYNQALEFNPDNDQYIKERHLLEDFIYGSAETIQ